MTKNTEYPGQEGEAAATATTEHRASPERPLHGVAQKWAKPQIKDPGTSPFACARGELNRRNTTLRTA